MVRIALSGQVNSSSKLFSKYFDLTARIHFSCATLAPKGGLLNGWHWKSRQPSNLGVSSHECARDVTQWIEFDGLVFGLTFLPEILVNFSIPPLTTALFSWRSVIRKLRKSRFSQMTSMVPLPHYIAPTSGYNLGYTHYSIMIRLSIRYSIFSVMWNN